MKYLAFALALILRLADSQRCSSVDANSTVPESCIDFYRHNYDNAYYDGGDLPGIREALNHALGTAHGHSHSNTSNSHDQCMHVIGHYLCHYYYPVCDVEHDEIVLVCSSSCNLLFNNELCSELFMDTLTLLVEQNISESLLPSSDSCAETSYAYDQQPDISDSCLDIEVSLDEFIPLNCEEMPQDFCSTTFPNITHYAPGTLAIDANPDELQHEISRIGNLQDFTMCIELIDAINCIIRYPACSANMKKVTPVCQSQCLSIDYQAVQCLIHLAENMLILDFPLVVDLLRTVECDKPETYYNFPSDYIDSNSTDCLMLTLSSAASSTTISDNDSVNVGIIVGVVMGTLIVVVVFIAILLKLILRARKKDKPVKKLKPVLQTRNSEASIRYVSNTNLWSQYASQHSIDSEANLLQCQRASVTMELNLLLFHVKEKLSEVLLPVETVTKLEILGKGKFGVVHKGNLLADDGNHKVVAIKTIKSGSLDAIKDLVAESAIMKTFHHPNVLPLLGVCIDYDDEDVLKIVIPFMVNGDLRNFLKNNRVALNNTQEYPEKLPKNSLKKMCLDIAKGMEYLAERRFIHRDLAARNCMVDENLSIKIADFGLARDMYSTEYYRVEQHVTLPVKWMPLESLMDGYFDEKSDVWSYGVTCWEIFSLGRIPYPGVDNANVISLLKSGKRLEQPYLCPEQFYVMMKNTWNEEPEKRPLFTDIVKFLHEQIIKDALMDDVDRATAEQIIEDAPMDDMDHATADGENDSSYLVVFQSHTTNDS